MEDTRSMIKQVFDAIADEAKKNGRISYEELEILKQVKYDLFKYEASLKRALDDGVITPEENERLQFLKQQVETNAVTVANFDGLVDREEQEMLSVLAKVLDKYLG
ncbi:MAG: hypothetical protein ACXAE3_14890 [Candidatus Kariarchaeaceae archaeon]|jgi:tellurite resistance protein